MIWLQNIYFVLNLIHKSLFFILRAYLRIEMYKHSVICLVLCTIHTVMGIESNVYVSGGKELEIDHRQKLNCVNEQNEDFQAQSEDREAEEGTFQ